VIYADHFHRGLQVPVLLVGVNEPPHVHVIRAERVAKIWLNSLEVEYNRGYNKTELNRILKLTEQNETQLLEAWHEHFDR
jgi:hypothetical protein